MVNVDKTRFIMDVRGTTQSDLVKDLGLSKSRVSRLLIGEVDFPRELERDLSRYLGVSDGYLSDTVTPSKASVEELLNILHYELLHRSKNFTDYYDGDPNAQTINTLITLIDAMQSTLKIENTYQDYKTLSPSLGD